MDKRSCIDISSEHRMKIDNRILDDTPRMHIVGWHRQQKLKLMIFRMVMVCSIIKKRVLKALIVAPRQFDSREFIRFSRFSNRKFKAPIPNSPNIMSITSRATNSSAMSTNVLHKQAMIIPAAVIKKPIKHNAEPNIGLIELIIAPFHAIHVPINEVIMEIYSGMQ